MGFRRPTARGARAPRAVLDFRRVCLSVTPVRQMLLRFLMALDTCFATILEQRRPLRLDTTIPDPVFTSTHAIVRGGEVRHLRIQRRTTSAGRDVNESWRKA